MDITETGNRENARTFSPKAFLAAFIGLFTVVAGSKVNTALLGHDALVGCHLGLWIYFYFFVLCAFWNPLACRFCRALEMNIREIAFVMIVTLCGGGFAWIGWMRQLFTQTAIIPQNALSIATWKQYRIYELFNSLIFPNMGKADETVIGGFINGTSSDGKLWIRFKEIPFYGWMNMFYWGALIVLVIMLSAGMLMIVHRQWTRHEKLSYPLTYFAEALFIKSKKSDCFADLFHSRLFWGAFSFVSFIHLYNYLAAWFPKYVFPIKLGTNLDGLSRHITAMNTTGASSIANIKLYFVLFGIAYFLAPSLSLSVGLNAFLYLIFASQVYNITGAPPTDAGIQAMRAGAYLAFAIMLVFLGRRYYGSVMLKALGFGSPNDDDRQAVYGARLFLFSFIYIAFVLSLMGLDIVMASIFTLIMAVVYLVFTRIVCEAGIPYMSTPFMPVFVEAKMLGGAAIGPANLMIKGLLSGVLFGDLRQLLMPYMATGAKIADSAGIKSKHIFSTMMIASVAAFALAFVVYLWQYYSFGITTLWSKTDGWKMGVTDAVNEITRLHINGNYDSAVNAGMLERIGMLTSAPEVWVFFVLGLLGVFVFGFLRVRFLWWPFHAMIFCFWNTAPANAIWFSFLLGWFVRMLIVRFGGERNYINFKPLFLGLIFGEIFAGGLIMLIGLVYYLCNNLTSSQVVYKFFIS